MYVLQSKALWLTMTLGFWVIITQNPRMSLRSRLKTGTCHSQSLNKLLWIHFFIRFLCDLKCNSFFFLKVIRPFTIYIGAQSTYRMRTGSAFYAQLRTKGPIQKELLGDSHHARFPTASVVPYRILFNAARKSRTIKFFPCVMDSHCVVYRLSWLPAVVPHRILYQLGSGWSHLTVNTEHEPSSAFVSQICGFNDLNIIMAFLGEWFGELENWFLKVKMRKALLLLDKSGVSRAGSK